MIEHGVEAHIGVAKQVDPARIARVDVGQRRHMSNALHPNAGVPDLGQAEQPSDLEKRTLTLVTQPQCVPVARWIVDLKRVRNMVRQTF